jgi:uncharacterized protein (TIGR03435 family)
MTERIVSRLDLRTMRSLIALGSIAFATTCLHSQQSPTPAAAPATAATTDLPTLVYDVASIHKFKPDDGPMIFYTKTNPDGLAISHIQIKSLVGLAYGVNDYQVTGSPEWASSDMYDVSAKMDEPAMEALGALSPEQKDLVRQRMAQTLLADRFKLAVHHETKQFPIYALVVAKGGPKLHESKPDDDYKNGLKGFDGQAGGKGMMQMRSDSGGFLITAQAFSMDRLAAQLSGQLNSHVQNHTGMAGTYDFTLRFSMNDSVDASASDPSVPSLFTALQDQLGLKLESTKGPLDVIVIDHIERPSEN